MSSHATLLQLQGQDSGDVDAVASANPDSANLSTKDRTLLEYVKVLTLEPANVKDKQVEAMRAAGWNDEEIFEASFITALFAFFNRMADAYGLDYPAGRWLPPNLRPNPVPNKQPQ